jgi:hypothetical protein
MYTYISKNFGAFGGGLGGAFRPELGLSGRRQRMYMIITNTHNEYHKRIHAHFRPEFGPELAPKWGSAGEVGERYLGASEPELARKASESLGPPDTAWSVPVGAASAKRADRRERTDLDGSGRRRVVHSSWRCLRKEGRPKREDGPGRFWTEESEERGRGGRKGRLEIETRRFETRSFPKSDCK